MNLQIDTRDLEGVFDAFNAVAPHSLDRMGREQYSIPEEAGLGGVRRICLRQGMELNWFDASFRNPVKLDIDVGYPHLEISYTLSGQGCCEARGQGGSFEFSEGVSTLAYMRDTSIHAELSSAARMLHMELRLDLRSLDFAIPELERLSGNTYFCRQAAGDPHIQLLVEQMGNCPYGGSLQKLYLEGKALELLALRLNGIGKEDGKAADKSKLTAQDIHCLRRAKEILDHTWRQPPGLLELARRVCLNDYKLKSGFKELFGTTVFGYVRGLRMNEARTILEQGKASVSEAAVRVGYHNFSHFASLFRKTYGYNPSEIGRTAIFAAEQACGTEESV